MIHPLHSLLPLVAATALTAQQLPVEPKPVTAPDAIESQLQLALRELAYSPDRSGGLWAASGHYKLHVRADGSTAFVPFLSSEASRSWPVAQRLRAVTVGGQALSLIDPEATPVQRRDDTVDLVHAAGLRERWLLATTSAEQTFVFDTLPNRGALTLRLEATTDLEITPLETGGFLLSGPDGAARMSAAFAYDAVGRRCAVETVWAHGVLEHRVPADFVHRARLPLVVDPVLYQDRQTMARGLRRADVAAASNGPKFVVVAERPWDATDGDIVAWFRAPDGTFDSGPYWIDASGDDWRAPRVATSNLLDRAMFVASVNDPATGWYIRGRQQELSPPYAMHPAFDITLPSILDDLHPDVGGDPTTATSSASSGSETTRRVTSTSGATSSTRTDPSVQPCRWARRRCTTSARRASAPPANVAT